MAETPQAAVRRTRPLSPHLTHYQWPVTMVTSITHRATGIALAVGTVFLAWWLVATASGPDAFATFNETATTPLGLVVLFGFIWSLAFHLLAGLRYLAWDLGYGFKKTTASSMSVVIIVLSVLIAVGVFALAYLGKGGYFT